MRISASNLIFDLSFYSGCLMGLIIIIFLIKKKYLLGKYRKSMVVDSLYIFIFACIFIYDSSRDVSTCDFFYGCYPGENDSLLANSYTYTVKGSECPRNLGPLIRSFSNRHSNGNLELRHVSWANNGLANICTDSPYGCCYISTYCDTMVKLGGDFHYSRYISNIQTGPNSLHFSSINTLITQMDVNGTNCPQLDDIILDYLHKKREQNSFYCWVMVVCYLIPCIIQLCMYKKYPNFNERREKYNGINGGIERDPVV